MAKRDNFTPVAEQVPFDNDTNGFIAEEVQGAIEELNTIVSTSASPGFSFGRSGNLSTNTWLSNESVPSNKSGRYVYIDNAVVNRVFVSNEDLDTFDLSIYHHEGDEINLTLLGTVSIVASRGGEFTVSWAVPTGTQLAMKITSGSGKNMVAGLELSGTN